jgi:2-C-methyl-D-erythritol 4-phosphate cytidylyltransferase
MKTTAIVLAAGQGKRMGSDVAKQYLLLRGKPVLYYTLKNFEDSPVDEIVLVTAKEQIDYCKEEIVAGYGFQKVRQIVAGGKERYHSVALGLHAIAEASQTEKCDYVLIHDGARPFATPEMIERGIAAAIQYDACVLGMPAKDTIKISDEEGFAADTPNRSLVWQIQTPQIFAFSLIRKAYEQLLCKEKELKKQGITITDDAMVMELFSEKKVKLVEGSYENIKLTTPEDLKIAESFLTKMQ